MVDGDGSCEELAAEERPVGGIESATFEVTREELRTTFEYQVQRLREIDTKAIEILKANLLLIGIVVTGGSVLVQTDLEVAPFVNGFALVAGLLLLGSTGLAAVTDTASNLRGGLDADAVETAITLEAARDGSESGFEERLLRSYARWIDYNARVTAVNDMLATVTVLLVFVAFVYLAAGVGVAVLELERLAAAAVFLATTAVSTAFVWFAYHMDHLGAEGEEWDGTFEGIRLSKGTTRRRGLVAFRGMLDHSTRNEREDE